MSKLTDAMEKGKAFIPFLTAGDPDADSTVRYILAMARAGADIIEIGVPFSDPTAESPMIQEASLRALDGGMTMNGVFKIVRRVRAESNVPIVLYSYMNPVYFYGYPEFFARCEELGIDGFISPDLPYEEKGEVEEYAREHGVDVISMIAASSGDRIPEIAGDASGFIHIVSSVGAVGTGEEVMTDLTALINEVVRYAHVKAVTTYGILEPEQACNVTVGCGGVAVSGSVVRLIEKYGADAEVAIADYVRRMKSAL